MTSIQDLPIEIVKKIFKNLDPISVKNCSITCIGWKEIVAHYILQPYLQELAVDENLSLSLKQKIRKKGWTHDCVDYNLIIALYEEFKFFKGNANFNKFRQIISFQMFLIFSFQQEYLLHQVYMINLTKGN